MKERGRVQKSMNYGDIKNGYMMRKGHAKYFNILIIIDQNKS